jgi:hypothetical protein
MLCKEIMQWPVRWVSEQDMGLHAKSPIVCTDAGGHIEGVISVGDLAVKDQGAGHTLKRIATREVRTVAAPLRARRA